MDDPQEFKSLDDLFRKTFENLPDKPAPSGWDKPSPRVWEQVRTQIPTPRQGWTGKSILLISGMAIVLMLGLYWALTQPAPTVENPPAPVDESPAAQVQTPTATAEEIQERPFELTANPKQAPTRSGQDKSKTSDTPRQASNNTQREDENARRKPAGSALLPGANPIAPNTTVRRQLDTWRGAPWAQPLNPLPTVLERPVLRPVPESLKNLGKN